MEVQEVCYVPGNVEGEVDGLGLFERVPLLEHSVQVPLLRLRSVGSGKSSSNSSSRCGKTMVGIYP